MAADSSSAAAAAALLLASPSAPRPSPSSSPSLAARSTRAASKTAASHRFSPISSAFKPGTLSTSTTSRRKAKTRMGEASTSARTADSTTALYAAAQALTAAYQHIHTGRTPTAGAGSNGSNGSNVGPKVPRKRNRAVLSCLKCHQRRVKCDRKQPCSACIRHGTPDECKVPDNAKAQQQRMRMHRASSSSASPTAPPRQDGNSAARSRPSIHRNKDAHMDGSGHQNHTYRRESGDEDELMDDEPAEPSSHFHSPSDPVARPSDTAPGRTRQNNTSFPSILAGAPRGLPAAVSPSLPRRTGLTPFSLTTLPPAQRSRFPSSENRNHLRPASDSPQSPHRTFAFPGNGPSSKRSYVSHRSADVLTRFINEYEGKFSSAAGTGTNPNRAPRSYSQEHVDEIWSFCENLPLRNLDILISSYLNDVDWMYQIVDANSVLYNLLPDLTSRILDPHLPRSARPQEWTHALRWGDMTRLALLGGMILGSVQATDESVLKLTFKQTTAGSPVDGSSSLTTDAGAPGRAPSLVSSNNHNNDGFRGEGAPPGLTVAAVAASGSRPTLGGNAILSSGQSARSGSSGIRDSRSSAGGPPASSRPANSVKAEVLSVLESQTRHILHLATTVEGPTPELVKAQLVMLNFFKNEARLAEPEVNEFLHETVDISMKVGMHLDPSPLVISEGEKEDRRRLFYNLYSFDRFAALFFGKQPCLPEEEVTTSLPQERWVIDGKEHLFSFLVLKGRLARIVTHIASAALQVPVDGDKVSRLEVDLQDFSKITQGTPFHPSLPQIPPELRGFHTLDRQRHLFLICYHSVREALHRLAFFQGPMISAQHAQYSREACAESAVVLLETQRSLRLRICSPGDLCCFYIPFFNLEPAITLIISAILLLERESTQSEADYFRALPVKKARVDYYMQWAQHALDLLSSMPEDIIVATQGSYLLRRVLRKAAIIVEHSTGYLLPGPLALGAATTKASLERTSAWMKDLFCDEHGQRMKMPYLTAPPRPPPFTRPTSRPETFLELQRVTEQSANSADARSLDRPEPSNRGPAASSTRAGLETRNLTASLIGGVNAGANTSAPPVSSVPVSELAVQGLDASIRPPSGPIFSALPAESSPVTATVPPPNAAVSRPDSYHSHPQSRPQEASREMAMRSQATSLPPGYVFDFSNGSTVAGVDGIVAAGGRSLADLGLGFFDTLFDSRHAYVPLGAAASGSVDAGTHAASAAAAAINSNTNDSSHYRHSHVFDLGHGQGVDSDRDQGYVHHHHSHGHELSAQQHQHDHTTLYSVPHPSSGPSTVNAGLAGPSSGGTGEAVNRSGGDAFAHEFDHNHNSGGVNGGSGGAIPGVGPSPEANLSSMGLEAYMNAWLLSIQNSADADGRG